MFLLNCKDFATLANNTHLHTQDIIENPYLCITLISTVSSGATLFLDTEEEIGAE